LLNGLLHNGQSVLNTLCATTEHKIFQVFNAFGSAAYSGCFSFCNHLLANPHVLNFAIVVYCFLSR
jgi:hypothetical protein